LWGNIGGGPGGENVLWGKNGFKKEIGPFSAMDFKDTS